MSEIRPPFVSFEMRAVEDRNASIQAGHLVLRDVPFICLVPHGSEGKTRIEQQYDEWLSQIKKVRGDVRAAGADNETPVMSAGRFPASWVEKIERAFIAWKAGVTLEIEGTPLRNWPVITKSQLANCEGLRLYAIEDLATASDDTIDRLGMGGRALQERARDWLKAIKLDAAPLTAELDQLRTRVADLEAERDELKAQLKAYAEAEKGKVEA